MKIRNFGKVADSIPIPNLVEIQRKAYNDFLQYDVAPAKRNNMGLESILREMFPIYNYEKTISLEYLHYTLGTPRYTPDECRKLKLSYGLPLRIRVRLNKEQPMEDDVYLGEVPLMIGGGEFIINGAERVIVSQLHRSPGIDFVESVQTDGRKLQSCRIIPERGSWIEINVTKKDNMVVRIDQSSKLPITTMLRAMDEKYSTDADIIREFYETEVVKLSSAKSYDSLINRHIVGDLIDKETGEIVLESGSRINQNTVTVIQNAKLKEIEVIKDLKDPIILNTLREDNTNDHESALMKIYGRLRPGNPMKIERAVSMFYDKFYDPNRYNLGRVGRFRINRKFGLDDNKDVTTLTADDFINCVKYIIGLRDGKGQVDDIDHLGNRRVRTLDELACDELRKGLLKLRRTIQERMSLKDVSELSPRELINSRTISSAIEYFFGRGELSQVVDQTNPLSQLTHERRLSALGPGGLNRKRAGFEVRDVHISHYGRICPIETPEGTNIGLISSLAIFSRIDEFGFLLTPYMKVENGRLTGKVEFLRADEEFDKYIGPAYVNTDKSGKIVEKEVNALKNGNLYFLDVKSLDYIDVSTKQIIGVSASLIPFLEHDDANRALMGANMQRQSVPLLRCEPPIVATGMEGEVARNSSMVLKAENSGDVTYVDAEKIVIDDEEYFLRKFEGLSEKTCLNQKPLVQEGDVVKAGQIIADGAGTSQGDLALGRNILVAFMPWSGYNFEDAILISEKVVKEDAYTSIHIEEFEIEIRETKLGKEEFTRDIPNVSEKALKDLDEEGIIQAGTAVQPGDILVGKVAPKSKSELSPEEKLLHAIFGKAGEDVKNVSLTVPSGVEGVVIDTKKFSRRSQLTEYEKKEIESEIRAIEKEFKNQVIEKFNILFDKIKAIIGKSVKIKGIRKALSSLSGLSKKETFELAMKIEPDMITLTKSQANKVKPFVERYVKKIAALQEDRERRISRLKQGDELPSGVLELVKIYIATKRTLSVGDKMAGRHGNKGVIAKIVPEEEMPFLADGTPIEIVLNPLGVPSRMNVGQILETHLGWAAKLLGFKAVCPVFSGASEDEIRGCLEEAGLPASGKTILHDGRTGEPFDQEVTVGYIYMMKLHHLVDDKVHARATGPYSLITQQPLGGKARFGGQRFGEMEVWALEAYGAAYTLQEMLTVKSDDVEGRTKIYESMVKGTNTLEAGTPVSFEVLTNEIRGLGLNMRLEKKRF